MRRLTPSDVDEIVTRYEGGESAKNIGDSVGVSWVAILNRLRQRGTAIRNKSQCQQRYSLNEYFFDVIDSEHKAYWLGFIAADGSVNGNALAVALAPYDKDHLEKLARTISSNHPVREYSYPRQPFVRFYIRSTHMTQSLSRYGIVPNKSLTLRFPDLPAHLTRHFIRGYVDGDGGFSIATARNNPSFAVTSNADFLKPMQQVLINECDLKDTKLYYRHPDVPIATLRYGGRNQVKKIHDYLYSKATVFLQRKKDFTL